MAKDKEDGMTIRNNREVRGPAKKRDAPRITVGAVSLASCADTMGNVCNPALYDAVRLLRRAFPILVAKYTEPEISVAIEKEPRLFALLTRD